MHPPVPLEPPPMYFPLGRGIYEVSAGLRLLGTDLGNGPMDQRVFQLDSDWPRYRANKLACCGERAAKHLDRADLDDAATEALVAWFTDRLTSEYPHLFDRAVNRLYCRLTGEAIPLDGDPFATFDQLAMQVQEDVCLTRFDGGRDWLAAGHVCSPGHWAITDKIGRPFTAIHQPVPGIETVNRSSLALVQAMIHRGPFVRFAWGLGTDDRLNHHPEPPAGVTVDAWRGRQFLPGDPAVFVRVERQVTWGLPAVAAAVFTIRVSHLGGSAIRADPVRRGLLRSALLSMSPASLAYKGLDGSLEAVLAWLDAEE